MLEKTLLLVQIVFYLATGTVIILTYKNARKSLLDTVFIRKYQKHVITALAKLSEELASEFDPDSPNYCCQPHTYSSRSSWLTALLWKSAQGVAESLSRAPVNRSTAARVAPARLAGTAGNKNKLSSYGSNAAAIEVRS